LSFHAFLHLFFPGPCGIGTRVRKDDEALREGMVLSDGIRKLFLHSVLPRY